ncbi:hypothetical protein J4475_01765 [Candidatus Woesearchaeota archaeon]|nr:hypothetical protein [Candidatus Woesearchaeota archaeon]
MLAWYFGLVGLLFVLIGILFFMHAYAKISLALKSGLALMIASGFLYAVFSGLVVFFGFIGYDIKKTYWQIVPMLFFISAVLFVSGAVRLSASVKYLNLRLRGKKGKGRNIAYKNLGGEID